MPVHDWTRVEAGIFHHFHQTWIIELARALNEGRLPADYYALAEQFAGGYGPDVLTLQRRDETEGNGPASSAPANGGANVLLAPPAVQLTAEAEFDFYRRKQTEVVVRHVSDDAVVAVIEVISPGNKRSRRGLEKLIVKVDALLDQDIHRLLIDLHPPGQFDREGIHGAIWEDRTGESYVGPAGKPLTLVAYQSVGAVRAYVHRFAVGEALIDMPLFLTANAHVPVPLEATYAWAFQSVPCRWREVLTD
jgi:hypothetical protein